MWFWVFCDFWKKIISIRSALNWFSLRSYIFLSFWWFENFKYKVWVLFGVFIFHFLVKRNFLTTRSLPWSTWTLKNFSQKPLKTRLEHFLSDYMEFCFFLKKKIFLCMLGSYWAESVQGKNFYIFFTSWALQMKNL